MRFASCVHASAMRNSVLRSRDLCASQSHRAPRQIGQSRRLLLGEFDIELSVEQQGQFNLRGNLLGRTLFYEQFRRALPRSVTRFRLQFVQHITLGLVTRSKRLAGFVFDGAGKLHGFLGRQRSESPFSIQRRMAAERVMSRSAAQSSTASTRAVGNRKVKTGYCPVAGRPGRFRNTDFVDFVMVLVLR